MTSIASPATLDGLVARLQRVERTSSRLWGKMNAHEMLCHLADSFLTMMGERQISSAETWMSQHVIKFIAIHTPLPWPKGIPTRPEVNPHDKGTRPAVFDRDRDTVIALMRRFASPEARYARHPMFGAMTRSEWLTWGFRHVDHHLRQFGL